MDEKKIALEETRYLLMEAWSTIYKVSKEEFNNEYYELRQAINKLEIDAHELLEKELNK